MTGISGTSGGITVCPAAVETIDVRKTYGSGMAETVAVAGITARFEKGRFTAIVGPFDHKPQEMSGGQRQRVAVARALAGNPAVVFADEPTGALDVKSSRQLLAILRDMASRRGQTIVMVTHDPNAAAYADRALVVRDGLIAADIAHPTAADVVRVLEQDIDSFLPPAGGVATGDGGWSDVVPRKDGVR